MDNNNVPFLEFLKSAKATAASVKQAAADTEALYGIKDPTDQGKATIPGCGDASNRSSMGIPANGTNLGEADKEHNIMSVTKPNGTGQGEYEVPRCGTSRDEAVKSPTAPISKMAGIAAIAANLRKQAETAAPAEVKEAAAAPAEKEEPSKEAAAAAPEAAAPAQEKAAAPAVQLPTDFANDEDLMSKLASMAAVALGSEQGRQAFAEILEHEAGVKEACALVAQAAQATKEAAAQVKKASSGLTYTDFQLTEMSKQAHAAWMGQFTTDLEKQAYAQGVEDANAMADQVDAGAEPALPGAGEEGLNDDQILQILQELVASGEVSQEEAEAILSAIGEGAADGVDPEELAAGLQAAVESGELTPDQAAAIAQEVMGGAGAGAEVPAGEEEAAAAAAAQDPAVAAAAEQAVEKAASVAKYLWGAK